MINRKIQYLAFFRGGFHFILVFIASVLLSNHAYHLYKSVIVEKFFNYFQNMTLHLSENLVN